MIYFGWLAGQATNSLVWHWNSLEVFDWGGLVEGCGLGARGLDGSCVLMLDWVAWLTLLESYSPYAVPYRKLETS